MTRVHAQTSCGGFAGSSRFLPVLERHLRDRRYMVGDALTLAD